MYHFSLARSRKGARTSCVRRHFLFQRNGLEGITRSFHITVILPSIWGFSTSINFRYHITSEKHSRSEEFCNFELSSLRSQHLLVLCAKGCMNWLLGKWFIRGRTVEIALHFTWRHLGLICIGFARPSLTILFHYPTLTLFSPRYDDWLKTLPSIRLLTHFAFGIAKNLMESNIWLKFGSAAAPKILFFLYIEWRRYDWWSDEWSRENLSTYRGRECGHAKSECVHAKIPQHFDTIFLSGLVNFAKNILTLTVSLSMHIHRTEGRKGVLYILGYGGHRALRDVSSANDCEAPVPCGKGG